MASKEPTKIQRADASSPATSADRKSVLERAKDRTRTRDRPGDMTGTPRFDDLASDPRMQAAPGAGTPPPSALSKGTSQALEAVAAANKTRPAEPATEEEPTAPEDFDAESIAETLRCDLRTARRIVEVLYPEREPGSTARLRKAVEARVGPLDIGEFLMNGVASQRVPIIPASDTQKGLEVVFATTVDGVEVVIDRMISDEGARIRHIRLSEGSDKVVDAQMSEREFVRRQNELAVAVHVRSYMGNAWPALVNAQGLVDEAAVQKRLALVRQISAPLFVMIVNNLGWFLERVQETLDVAVLGNG